MEIKIAFEMDKGKYRVPVSQELYLKNLEYFRGMGFYDEAVCREKALITTGFRIVRPNEQDTQ